MRLRNIAFNNLRRRKARMAFLVTGLLIGIATVVTLLSLTSSLTMEAEHKLDSFGANIVITPHSDSLSLSYGGISLGGVTVDQQEIREQDLARIASIPNARNVAAVAPKVLGAVPIGDKRALVMGVDYEKEFHIKRWWSVDGRPLANDNELVAGSAAARSLGLAMGDTLELGDEEFTVSGILRETGSQDDELLIVSLPAAQWLLGKQGKVSLVEVAALCGDCPIEDMVNQISTALPEAKVSAIQQVVKTRMHALEQFKTFSLGVAGVVILIGALVVFVTMMGSVNERTREIGIFRALGFRRGHVIGLILMEASSVSLLAGLLGFFVGMGATRLILPFLAEEHPMLIWSPELAAGSILLALVVGTLASFYPALHASRMDPNEALRAL
ncbi:ABC transporter permease [Desulfuromonas versatilis]|uniref:ABC transporter permease n=1 Tax=Desulfuromonas versatilis TaxID=2802975 RepID=A0ABN6DZC7_9BACT|nr:FtsX-like permease family protein [Desulfuromonas versatilis]BCR05507.1 ABC transporter permease [Desulfuromonas versatilis]